MATQRQLIEKAFKWFSLSGLALLLLVLLDFSFNLPDTPEYRFNVPPLKLDQPVLLQQQNVMVIVMRMSTELRQQLMAGSIASSTSSRQLFDQQGYSAFLGYGSYLGCPLRIETERFLETCSEASYDWLGRSQNPSLYGNLDRQNFRFSSDYRVLTID